MYIIVIDSGKSDEAVDVLQLLYVKCFVLFHHKVFVCFAYLMKCTLTGELEGYFDL